MKKIFLILCICFCCILSLDTDYCIAQPITITEDNIGSYHNALMDLVFNEIDNSPNLSREQKLLRAEEILKNKTTRDLGITSEAYDAFLLECKLKVHLPNPDKDFVDKALPDALSKLSPQLRRDMQNFYDNVGNMDETELMAQIQFIETTYNGTSDEVTVSAVCDVALSSHTYWNDYFSDSNLRPTAGGVIRADVGSALTGAIGGAVTGSAAGGLGAVPGAILGASLSSTYGSAIYCLLSIW